MFENRISQEVARFIEYAERVRAVVQILRGEVGSDAPGAVAPRPGMLAPNDRTPVRAADGRLHISAAVLDAVSATIGARPAESGGFLGITDGVVDLYRFDQRSSATGATYAPDIVAANEERRVWERRGSRFAGFIHSHPGSFALPSSPDREYAQRILATAKVAELLLPIVLPAQRRRVAEIAWFVARPGAGALAAIEPVEVEVVRAPSPAQFARLAGAYDTDWLQRCRVIAVGCGGARSALENLARIGVGQFVLIDPDIVSVENLATQAVRRHEVGRPKVLATGDAIHEINPDASVVALHCAIQDLPREQLDVLVRGCWAESDKPARTLIGMWSDSPAANAYAHRVALHFGVPAVSASLHVGGVSGEVGLMYPGRTKACHRCATHTRYAHFARGGTNDASSAGVAPWTTERLNATKLCVTAAALQAGDDGMFGLSPERRHQTALLERIAERPLGLLRLSPDAGEVSGLRVHDNVFAGCARPDRLLFDETVWREVEPLPGCPDCGGCGDLLAAYESVFDFNAFPGLEATA